MQPRYIDQYVERLNADHLKRMVRVWGGASSLRKDSCISMIQRGLQNPDRVAEAIARMTPLEQMTLALLKQYNNQIKGQRLLLALSAANIPNPTRKNYGSRNPLLPELIERGIIVTSESYGYYNYEGYYFYADTRLLEQVSLPRYTPLPIRPITLQETSVHRPLPNILLDFMNVLKAIESHAPLGITKSGKIRANILRKIKKSLGWDQEKINVDGFEFQNPLELFLQVLKQGTVLVEKEDELHLTQSLVEFAQTSPLEQIRLFLHGWVQDETWQEAKGLGHADYASGRLAILIVLTALPADKGGFYSIVDFESALFDRIGSEFSIGHTPGNNFHFNFQKTRTEQKSTQDVWQKKLREHWQKQTVPWLYKTLTTWLYYLGLVELVMDGAEPAAFRLTKLGWAVLHPERNIDWQPKLSQAEAAWIIQPNFELIVYLDRVRPEQLLFLEQHAERTQVQKHIAQYQLNRDSTYRALEQGSKVATIMQTLEAGAGGPLPRNVQIELKEWGQLRDLMTVHTAVNLLEFETTAARDTYVRRSAQYEPIGERFASIPKSSHIGYQHVQAVYDYGELPARCITLNESGAIKLRLSEGDLLIQTQLSKWAEQTSEIRWELTPESVGKAVKAKAKIEELFDFLQERLITPRIPRFLGIALSAWGRKRYQAELSTVTILRCSNPDVLDAIVKSRKLKQYVVGHLAPDLLLVASEHVDQLRENLDWAGIKLSNVITSPA